MRLSHLLSTACTLVIAFISTNCHHIQPELDPVRSAGSARTAGADVTITVTFYKTPPPITTTIADLKYNKSIGFMLVKDDGGMGDYDVVYPYIMGGTAADGSSYPGMTYTDGTGQSVPWHYTFAWNANNTHDGSNPGAANWAQARAMFASGAIDFSNHSLTHAAYYSRYYDLKQNEINLYNQLGIRTRTFTVPTDYEGFVETGFSLGYTLMASQGYGAGGQASDDNNNWPDNYNVLWTEKVKSNETRRLITTRRWWGDGWSSADLTNAKQWVDDAFTTSTGTSADTKFVYQGFSHGLNYPFSNSSQYNNYKAFLQYIRNHSKNRDRTWIAGLQEFAEYIEVKQGLIKSQSISGNTMTITLDYSQLNPDLMWRDVSLLVGGATFKSVTVTGADKFTFNGSTGLINIYKKKTSGFSNPSLDVAPPQLTSVQTADATGINLTFDRPVSQSMIAGWKVTSGGVENPIAALTGSDTNWKLTLQNAMPANQPTLVDYRIQRGNAVDAATGQKVVSYIGYAVANSN